MFQLKSLQQRLALYLLLPVTLLLIGMGIVGFLYAKNSLQDQWREAAVLKLQRAAHHVDMKLSAPKELLKLFNRTGGISNADYLQDMVIQQIEAMSGVARVNLTWFTMLQDPWAYPFEQSLLRGRGHMPSIDPYRGMRRFHRTSVIDVTPPRYDALVENQTVSLTSELKSKAGKTIGRLEVVLKFDALIDEVVETGWWQSHQAFLVDNAGKILFGTTSGERRRLGENGDVLELRALKLLNEKESGTLLGPGHPPLEILGFYRLKEAPWRLVMIAPGKEIFSPIIKFRNYYLLTGSAFILFILLLIRWMTGKTVRSIREVSKAAEKVARSQYGNPLPVKTHDEVGELIQSFNTMVTHLEDRNRLKKAINLAMEVQQNLLPGADPQIEGLDIAGKSLYCDETGGDYYDFLTIGKNGNEKPGVVVGDVSDHGISSALLMATARALFRQRSAQSGNIADIVSDVNRQLAMDVEDSGRFMTVFFLAVDLQNKRLQWVRAGHDPAIFYDPAEDDFELLKGSGIALAVEKDQKYEAHEKTGLKRGQVILLGTDGIWEAQNPNNDVYGKEAIFRIIRQNPNASTKQILETVFEELREFRKGRASEDDVTLVVIKIEDIHF
jgi:phosphoserine phosphatase RsbU/P